MTPRGLLIESYHGQEFLLAVEPCKGMKAYQLVVLEKINGVWKRVKGIQESAIRETALGALVDFFADICRVIDSDSHELLPEAASKQPAANRSRIGQLRP